MQPDMLDLQPQFLPKKVAIRALKFCFAVAPRLSDFILLIISNLFNVQFFR
jgi:hypothetical protein